jgi:quercetin dioxygenase-like cupin family protein
MALLTKPVTFGNLKGTVYDFEVKGDVLPMHWHAPENTHITIVGRGSFKAHGPEGTWEKVLNTGDVVDWQAYQQHEFIALEDKSRLVNIVKGSGEPGNEYGTPPQ